MNLHKQFQKDFPFLQSNVAYLDNAATTQKPDSVIDAISEYYENYAANVHRGIYEWSETASAKYEEVREKTARFIGAETPNDIIFTSGTTQSLNLAARLLTQDLQEGDEIIVSQMEHHANLIPWQIVAKEKGLRLQFLLLNDEGEITVDDLQELLTERTKILAITHMSNVTGYVAPVQQLCALAKQVGVLTVVDGAQSIPHMPINVQELGADCFAFSAHKMCGPTGVGVLYMREELQKKYEPVFGGGNMIGSVELDTATWAEPPAKFEPGTPNVAGVLGLGVAIEYLENIGMDTIEARVQQLHDYAREELQKLEYVHILGPHSPERCHSILSFTVEGIHPHDIASVLDSEGVAVRAGHHCAQPLLKLWNVPATTRASLYFYNITEDVDRLVKGIQKAIELFH